MIKEEKIAKMLRKEFLTPVKTPHLPVLPLPLNTIQTVAFTSEFKQEFFHMDDQMTAHSLSHSSRFNMKNDITKVFVSSICSWI